MREIKRVAILICFLAFDLIWVVRRDLAVFGNKSVSFFNI